MDKTTKLYQILALIMLQDAKSVANLIECLGNTRLKESEVALIAHAMLKHGFTSKDIYSFLKTLKDLKRGKVRKVSYMMMDLCLKFCSDNKDMGLIPLIGDFGRMSRKE